MVGKGGLAGVVGAVMPTFSVWPRRDEASCGAWGSTESHTGHDLAACGRIQSTCGFVGDLLCCWKLPDWAGSRSPLSSSPADPDLRVGNEGEVCEMDSICRCRRHCSQCWGKLKTEWMEAEEKSPFPGSELGSSALVLSRCRSVAPGLAVQCYRWSKLLWATVHGMLQWAGDHISGEHNPDQAKLSCPCPTKMLSLEGADVTR